MKIPKGWKQVKLGQLIRKGDKFLFDEDNDEWVESNAIGVKYGKIGLASGTIYIRRVRKAKR